MEKRKHRGKTKKLWHAALFFMTACFLLSSCKKEPVTMRSTLAAVQSTAAGTASGNVDAALAFRGTVRQNEEETNFTIHADRAWSATLAPVMAKGTVSVHVSGLSEQYDLDYTAAAVTGRDGSIKAYCDYGMDGWESVPTPPSMDDPLLLLSVLDMTLEAPDAEADLAQSTLLYQGMIGGKPLERIITGILNFDSTFVLSGIDWTSKQVPVDVTVDTKTMLPIEATLDCSGIAEWIAESVMGRLGIRLELAEFTASIEFSDLGRVKGVDIPRELMPEAPEGDIF